MSGDSLREKQKKLQLESSSTIDDVKNSHQSEDKTVESPHVEQANREWRQFYTVIREITNDMRY